MTSIRSATPGGRDNALAGPNLTASEPRTTAALAAEPRLVRIGLVGFGRVASAFAQIVRRHGRDVARRDGLVVRIETVLVADATKPRGELPEGALFTDDPDVFLARRFDVVVEATACVDAVAPLVVALLERGVPVVTANKALVAGRSADLCAAAAGGRTALFREATVAAAVPLFSTLDNALRTTTIRSVTAILNGTANFILGAETDGCDRVQALAEARRRGFAEPDASDDLSLVDAARKLAILVEALGGGAGDWRTIERTGIEELAPKHARRAAAVGGRFAPIAAAHLGCDGVEAWTSPAFVPGSHPFAAVRGAANGLVLEGDPVAELILLGPGAGPEPTAAALFDDVLAASRRPGRANAGRGAPGDVACFRAPERSWHVQLAVDPAEVAGDDLIEWAQRAGISFRALTARQEGELLVFVGTTTPSSRRRLDDLKEALGPVRGVREVFYVPSLDGRGNS